MFQKVVLIIIIGILGCKSYRESIKHSDIRNNSDLPHDEIQYACGFSHYARDVQSVTPSEIRIPEFEAIVQSMSKLAFMSSPLVIKTSAGQSLPSIASVSRDGKINTFIYRPDSLFKYFDFKQFSLDRNWQSPAWDTSDYKFFPVLFVIAHELSHLANDHNFHNINCGNETKKREWICDSIAGSILYRLNISPLHYVTEALFRFHSNNECYPELIERVQAAVAGYMEALHGLSYDVMQSYNNPLTPPPPIVPLTLRFQEILYSKKPTSQNIYDLIYVLENNNNYFDNSVSFRPFAFAYGNHTRSLTQLYAVKSPYIAIRKCNGIIFDTVDIKSLRPTSDWQLKNDILYHKNATPYQDPINSFIDRFDNTQPAFFPYKKEQYYIDSLTKKAYVIDSFVMITIKTFKEKELMQTQFEYYLPHSFFTEFIGSKNNSLLFPNCTLIPQNDTIRPYMLSIFPDINDIIDMGFTFDESARIEKPKETFPVYSLSGCQSLNGLVTTQPNSFPDCVSTFIGYLVSWNF